MYICKYKCVYIYIYIYIYILLESNEMLLKYCQGNWVKINNEWRKSCNVGNNIQRYPSHILIYPALFQFKKEYSN